MITKADFERLMDCKVADVPALAKIEIAQKLTAPTVANGMSDSKWQKIAEKLAKKYNVTTLDILFEYEKQKDAAWAK